MHTQRRNGGFALIKAVPIGTFLIFSLVFSLFISSDSTSAALHPQGTNVSSQGTVYYIDISSRRPYPSKDIFLSYSGNSFSAVVVASAEDLALPVGALMLPAEGTLVDYNRTVYLIESEKKRPFVSKEVFLALGYSFDKVIKANIGYVPTGEPIISTSTVISAPAPTSTTDSSTTTSSSSPTKTSGPSATTKGPKLSISSITATNITQTSVTILWSTNVLSSSSVNYGLTLAYGTNSEIDYTLTKQHSISLSNLSPSTLYHYRVNSKDQEGTLLSSSDQTFTTASATQPADTTAPSVPANLAASNITTSSVVLSWSASTDNVAVAGYNIFRNGSKITTTTGTTYQDTNLSASTNYNYSVSAFDSSGNTSAVSSSISAATQAAPASDTTAPTISITSPTAGQTLSGTVSLAVQVSDNVGVVSVLYKVDGINLGNPITTSPYVYSLNTTTLTNGSHTISATAMDAAGNISTPASVSVSVNNQAPLPTGNGTPLTACGNLTASGNYYLANDVSSSRSCFSVQAAGITLDLNGRTITYGTCAANDCYIPIGNISTITRNNNVVTVTLSSGDAAKMGKVVRVSGAADPTFNGSFPVETTPNTTTITYYQYYQPNGTTTGGVAERSLRNYGIISAACWNTTEPKNPLDNNPCGSPGNNFTVFNGKIVQSPSTTPFSDAIHIGQCSNCGNVVVRDLDITISATSSVAFYLYKGGGTTNLATDGGVQIYNNIIRDNVLNIFNRHQLQGVAIYIGSPSISPDHIYNNTIIGSPQGGIMTYTKGSKIYGNSIAQSSYFTNDFCIYIWGDDQEVYQNNCDPAAQGSGRGFHISAKNASVHDNIIKVRELPRNKEYNGCELGGAYGIQLESAANGANVYNNDVTAYALECDATALRATGLAVTAANNVHDNNFKALRLAGATARANGFSASNPAGGLTITNNTFTTDTQAIYTDWDGGSNIKWVNNTFAVGSNPVSTGWNLIRLFNSVPVTGYVIQDPIYANGASEKYSMIPIGYGGWGGTEEYFIKWTQIIIVKNSSGAPVSGATVVIKDALNNTEFTGTTDAQGKVNAVLTQHRRYNSSTVAANLEVRTPHMVTVSASGFATSNSTLTSDSIKTTTVVLQ